MNQMSRLLASSCLMLTLASSQVVAAGIAFYNLGPVEPRAVSADGSVVVGAHFPTQVDDESEAFRWTAVGGLVGLGDFPGQDFASEATGVSADGTVVAGYGTTESGYRAFRWTSATGLVPLGPSTIEFSHSIAYGISPDGSTLVGAMSVSGNEPDEHAFRWTAADGVIPLDRSGPSANVAFAASHDGRVIIGMDSDDAAILSPSLEILGGVPRASQSIATDVSSDGSIAVGWSLIGGESLEAVRWVDGGSAQGLGFIPGALSSEANAVSPDGSIVVGRSGVLDLDLGVLQYAAIWDAQHGMRDLKAVFESENGLMLPGWRLTNAIDISADGRTIIGRAIDPTGVDVGWVATVPEPNAAALILVTLGMLGSIRRRRKAAKTY
jgi:probable HAF family extracellular repeat protein